MQLRKYVAIAAFVMLFTATDAEAKRRGGGFVVIPGVGGGSETIVKVTDLPDIPALQREDGKYVDLGYLHKSSGGGEWIGYIGSSSRYVPMTPESLQVLMMLGGLEELPPVPEKKGLSASTIVAIAVFIGFLAVGKRVLKMVFGALFGGGARASRSGLVARANRKLENEDGSDVDWQDLERKIEAAAASAAPRPEPRPASAEKAGAPPRRAAPRRANAGGGFGRRGL